MEGKYIKYSVVGESNGFVRYHLDEEIRYHSPRYVKSKTVPVGFMSDGASGAVDIKGSRSWWIHDSICEDPFWDDRTPINAWMAARVLSDILADESKHMKSGRKFTRWMRSQSWFWATYLFGCKNARSNGWW